MEHTHPGLMLTKFKVEWNQGRAARESAAVSALFSQAEAELDGAGAEAMQEEGAETAHRGQRLTDGDGGHVGGVSCLLCVLHVVLMLYWVLVWAEMLQLCLLHGSAACVCYCPDSIRIHVVSGYIQCPDSIRIRFLSVCNRYVHMYYR